MRITIEAIQSRTGQRPADVRFLDLSNSEILAIENVSHCTNTHSLSLRGNYLREVDNLYALKHLWNLDLAHNEISSVTGLTRFVALGSLNLSFNLLEWSALYDIKHMYITSLHLHGNPALAKDPHYRMHVVNSLPNVWMLDGRFISATERVEVESFFLESALTKTPVRSKFTRKEAFVPTYKKDLLQFGVFGAKTEELFTNFPTSDNSLLLNIEMDRKKLFYMAHSLQENLLIESQVNHDVARCAAPGSFLEDVMSVRAVELERSNMLLILVVASLEFSIPYHVMREMLQTAQLDFFGGVNTLDMFEHPRRVRIEIATILLAASKVDRDEDKEGGLYKSLYLSVYCTVMNLVKAANCDNVRLPKRSFKKGAMYVRYRPVLAAEVVQLLCVTPSFFDIADRDQGIASLLLVACGSHQTVLRVSKLLKRARETQDDPALMEDIAKYVISQVQTHTSDVISGKTQEIHPPPEAEKSSKSSLGVRRPQMVPNYQDLVYRPRSGYKSPSARESLNWVHEQLTPRRRPTSGRGVDPGMGGIVGQRMNTARGSSRAGTPFTSKQGAKTPEIGDVVLLGPQNSGVIKALPDRGTAMLLLTESTALNGGVSNRGGGGQEQYVYIKISHYMYDDLYEWWRPANMHGDRVTLSEAQPHELDEADVDQLVFEMRQHVRMTEDSIPFPAKEPPSGEEQGNEEEHKNAAPVEVPHQEEGEPDHVPEGTVSRANSPTGSQNLDEKEFEDTEQGEDPGNDQGVEICVEPDEGQGMTEQDETGNEQTAEEAASTNHQEEAMPGEMDEDPNPDPEDSARQVSQEIQPEEASEGATDAQEPDKLEEGPHTEVPALDSDINPGQDESGRNSEVAEIPQDAEPPQSEEPVNEQIEHVTNEEQLGVAEPEEINSPTDPSPEGHPEDNLGSSPELVAEVSHNSPELTVQNKEDIQETAANDAEGNEAEPPEEVAHLEDRPPTRDASEQHGEPRPELILEEEEEWESPANHGISPIPAHHVKNDMETPRRVMLLPHQIKTPPQTFREYRFTGGNIDTKVPSSSAMPPYMTPSQTPRISLDTANLMPTCIGYSSTVNDQLTPRKVKSASSQPRRLMAYGRSTRVKSASSWLAGGKNVYKKEQLGCDHLIPGWVQSMEPRAQTAYVRNLIHRYQTHPTRAEEFGLSDRVRVRALSANMKYVCEQCSPGARRALSHHVTGHAGRVSDDMYMWKQR